MSTLLPPLDNDIESISELMEAAESRYGQACALDPWCGLPRTFLPLETRAEILGFFSLFAVVPAALTLALLAKGTAFLGVLVFGTIVFSAVLYASRRRSSLICRQRRESKVVLAWWIMANEDLFQDGSDELPGVVVYSFDDELRDDPERQWRLARAIGDLRRADPGDLPPELHELASYLREEKPDRRARRLPEVLGGTRETWVRDVAVDRRRLPHGKIERPVVFCVAHRSDPSAPIELAPLDLWWSKQTDALTVPYDEDDENADATPFGRPAHAPSLERLDDADQIDVVVDRHGVSIAPAPAAHAETSAEGAESGDEEPEIILVTRYTDNDVRQAIIALVAMLIIGLFVARFVPLIWLRLLGGGVAIYSLVQFATLSRQRGAHVRAEVEGLVDRAALVTTRLRWSEIDRVKMGEINKTVSGNAAGNRVRIEIDDTDERWDALLDAILTRTESLRWIAWGSGVGSSSGAPTDPETLPRSIEVTDREIYVRGPFDNLIRFPRRRPDFAMIEESLRCRLVPAMLEANPPGNETRPPGNVD